MFEVIYSSKTGNTRKIAELIAAELGVKAEKVKDKKSLAADSTVVIGSGCYGDKPADDMRNFIARNNFKGKKVAVFGTSGAGKGVETQQLQDWLKSAGAVVIGSYYCQGRAFYLVNRGHPTEEELEKAREFARNLKAA